MACDSRGTSRSRLPSDDRLISTTYFLPVELFHEIGFTSGAPSCVYAPTASTKEVDEKSLEFFLPGMFATTDSGRHFLYLGHDIYHGHGISVEVSCQAAT